ncbi:MAG: polysaccharide biosynthesis protein [Firmicutes bacterium]|nr:polysaccharide biosynthesis protein [Bacillota bacterium]
MGSKVVRGAAILLVAGVAARVLGFFYRAYLARAIGAQGMGLVAMAYPLWGMALNLASMGIPVAVAKVVAERAALPERSLENVLRFAFAFVLAAGTLLAVALVFSAPFLTHRLLSDPRSLYPLLAAVPLVLVIPASLVLRGYFQGLQEMHPLAVATVLEQVVRIAGVVYLVRYFLPYGLAWGAVGAMVAVALGEVSGLVVLLVFYRLTPRPLRPPRERRDAFGPTAREVLSLGTPVTGTRIVGSFTEIADATIIPRRLEVAGFTRDAATAFYGNLSAMAMPLVYFPTVLTGALASALMPAISEAEAAHGMEAVRRRTQQALHLTFLVAFPAATLYVALGHELGQVIYGQRQVGAMLVPLSLAAPCLYLDNTLAAVLRGLGRPALPMRNGLVGSFVRLALIFALTGVVGSGASLVLFAFALDIAVTCALDTLSVWRLVRPRLAWGPSVGLPLAASALMALACRVGLGVLGSAARAAPPAVATAVAAGVAVYAAVVYLAGGLRAAAAS